MGIRAAKIHQSDQLFAAKTQTKMAKLVDSLHLLVEKKLSELLPLMLDCTVLQTFIDQLG